MPFASLLAVDSAPAVATGPARGAPRWRDRPALRPRLAALLAAVLVAGLLGRPAAAQTGSVDPTPEQLAGLIPFDPQDIELVEQPAVDLRPWLPPVGTQRMNDCTAWAVGYAAKTYLEARDQGWRPDRPERIFSPNFLYNQINRGRDEGSNFIQAIRVMVEQGAATLASFPYVRDHRVQPDERQQAEAAAFPVFDGRLLRSRLAIRRALQRREIVVFGAHVGPIFMSGRFDTYDAGTFARDVSIRTADQAHGKHAMVIAGYDDDRGAFLVMNSWGPRWADRGYAWIAYELFDEIRIESRGEVFCNWACTIVDVEEPVERGPDGLPRPAPLDLQTLAARGHSDLVRYDPELGSYLYVFTVELTGQREAMARVEAVNWTWIDQRGEERTVRVTNADMRFGLQAGTTRNPLRVSGEAELADGTTELLSGVVRGPRATADWREVELIIEDEHYGTSPGGAPTHELFARLDYPLEQRRDVVKVEWDLGPQVRGGRRTFDAGGDVLGFHDIEGGAWTEGVVEATVRVHYNDGGVRTLRKRHEPSDPARPGFRLVTDTHVAGRRPDGQRQHAVSIGLDFPLGRRLDLERVEYVVDPHVSAQPLVAERAFVGRDHGYRVHVTSHRPFRVRATLHFEDGATQELVRWVELGEDAAYRHPMRVELTATDEYVGWLADGPRWSVVHRVIGDREVLERVESVRFATGHAEPWEHEVARDDLAFAIRHEFGTEDAEFPVSATLVFAGGEEIRLERTHRVQSARDDVEGLELSVRRRAWPASTLDPELTHDLWVRPAGPRAARGFWHRVDWRHTVGGRRERTVHDTGWHRLPDPFVFRTSFAEPFDLQAWVGTVSGWNRLLETRVTPTTQGDRRPDAALEVRERFWGYRDGRPWWSLLIVPRLDFGTAPGDVASWSLVPIAEDGQRYRPLEATGRDPIEFLIDRPLRFEATLAFENGTRRGLAGRVTTWSERTAEPLVLRAYRRGDDEATWLLVVDGWHRELRRIRGVRFEAGPGAAITSAAETTWTADPGPVVADVRVDEPATVRARLTMADDRELVLETALDPSPRPLELRDASRYWGDGEWETTLLVDGHWPRIRGVTSWVRSFLPEWVEFVHAWPPGGGRYRRAAHPRVLVELGPQDRPDELRTVEFAHGPRHGQTEGWELDPPETLRIVRERPPARIARHAPQEWLLRIFGPERTMIRVESVAWTIGTGDDARTIEVTDRWGELAEGFETRTFGAEAPAVRAVVTLRGADGERETVALTAE